VVGDDVLPPLSVTGACLTEGGGSRLHRVHEPAQTPLDRLLSHPDVISQQARRLRELRAQLDPFELSTSSGASYSATGVMPVTGDL